MCAVPHPAEGYCSRCHYCNIIYCGEFPGQGGAKRLVDEDEQGRGEEAALLDSPLKPVLEVFILILRRTINGRIHAQDVGGGGANQTYCFYNTGVMGCLGKLLQCPRRGTHELCPIAAR